MTKETKETNVSEAREIDHYSTREVIADRTGDLLREAFDVTNQFRKADIVGITEPDTQTLGIAVMRPNGETVPLPASFFDDYRDAPKRITGTAKMTRLPSFIDHVNRFKTKFSALFAIEDVANPRLLACFDYHSRGDEFGMPDFCEHGSRYDFPLSAEWKAWTADNKNTMDLGEFAAFLEDRIVDVLACNVEDLSEDMQRFIGVTEGKIGTPTKLVELSRGLRIEENSNVIDVRNINSGEGQISFQSEHSGTGGTALNIPTVFVICIPVFQRSEDFYRLVCRLRYRKTTAGVVFWYELWRPDRVFDAAFTEAIDNAAAATELPLFIGSAES